MKSKQKALDNYMINLFEQSGLKGDELTKHLIIYKAFYKETNLYTRKLSLTELKMLMSKFMRFVVQFETICVRAYKPSGSQSTAKDIIHMYSSKNLHKIETHR